MLNKMKAAQGQLKISPHEHSGKVAAHEHTSYIPLIALLLLVGVALTTFTVTALRPGPEPSSIGLSGTVPAKPPTVAAVITKPSEGQRFTTSPVNVAGSCPKNTLVEIFKNDIFAGSTPCTEAGIFTLDVDLLIGQNILVARVYDALNQPGPDSNLVTVFYDALPPQADGMIAMNFSGDQLLLNTDAVFRGVFPDQELVVPIDIIGGMPPYAVNLQWGDSTNKVISRDSNAPFKATHTYSKPGTYQLTVQASDAQGRVAFLTVASIVNGQPAVAPTATSPLDASAFNKMLMLWPLYTSAIAIVISFWLGERREKQILSKRGQLLGS